MRLSNKGIDLIKSFEGCLKPLGNGMFKPYICPAGVLTIGWGHTNDGGRPFTKASVWSQAECDQALADDMVRYEDMVKRRVKVTLNQSQFDALVSFTYNCGEGNLAKSSLLRSVNAGDFASAATQFAAWNRGGGKVLAGLTRRRAAEAALFRSGAAPVSFISTPDEPMPQRVDAPDESPPDTSVVSVAGDADTKTKEIENSAAADVETRGSWLSRKWKGLTGWGSGLTLTGLGGLYDPWVIVAVGGFFIFIVVAFVWFMGPGDVRAWVRKQVS